MNFSENFLESVLLLVLTAIMTGFLIPYIFRKIDEKRQREQQATDAREQREQKEFEAELARQTTIIESQVRLLNTLAELFWEYQLMAIAVTYWDPVAQTTLYNNAVSKYQENVYGLLLRLRPEISKSLRLTSHKMYDELISLYYDELVKLDSTINQLLMRQKPGEPRLKEWDGMNRYAVFKLSEKVDQVLDNLAQELRLKGSWHERIDVQSG